MWDIDAFLFPENVKYFVFFYHLSGYHAFLSVCMNLSVAAVCIVLLAGIFCNEDFHLLSVHIFS